MFIQPVEYTPSFRSIRGLDFIREKGLVYNKNDSKNNNHDYVCGIMRL